MQTKHFVNDPNKLVLQALKSSTLIQPELSLDSTNKILYAPLPNDRSHTVSIISGGGSGHEPSFSGFVGDGILAAGVAGTIFASPSSRQVLIAIENVASTEGVLITVMNYTGDVMNFGVALEKAKARNPQLKIDMLVVGDDVGVPRSRAGKVGRRGIAGTVLVHKITGAMAASGHRLEDIVRVGRLITDNLASIGVSLSRVHVPGRAVSEENEDTLASDEVELGMGIHNESGCERRRGAKAELPAVITEMLRQILDSNDPERDFLKSRNNEVVLLINNLGGLSVLELGAVVTEAVEQLQQTYQIKPVRLYSGTYMTSLDGPGFSISILNNFETGVRESLTELLDAPSNTIGWKHLKRPRVLNGIQVNGGTELASTIHEDQQEAAINLQCDLNTVVSSLRTGLNAVIASEPEITKYDSIVGDGDCGTTLKRGAEEILNNISSTPADDIVSLLTQITSSIEASMDGTSGALYGIFLNSLTYSFKSFSSQAIQIDGKFWVEALTTALTSLSKYTPAKEGDRTVMDALIPFVDALRETQSLGNASKAALEGAKKTKDLKPGLGRTVYIGNEEIWLGKIPDPGAWGLSRFLAGLSGNL